MFGLGNELCNATVVFQFKINMLTIIYWLIATATITFSKQKAAATKQGWLLYEGSY